ncbi:MAG TPA: YlxR family protein [Actinomycetota bacterium]|nr:YlxR family protein [Actinomycetota bacterium]
MTPRRTCVGCRRTASPEALLRVVRTGAGDLVVGRDLPGRGAWLCVESPACVDLAQRRDGFSRALRGRVDQAAVERLQAVLAARAGRAPGPPGGVGG